MSNLPSSAPCLLISDIHGCINTLTRLLNAAPKGVQLVFLGDLIDRGPNSRAVVELAINHVIPTCCGNHEDLCLAFYRHRGAKPHCANMYDDGVWLHNGGDKALKGWSIKDQPYGSTPKEQQQKQRDMYAGGRVPDSVLRWMEGLPAYLWPSTQVDENGRKLLASHTGYALNADKGDWFSTLWGRYRCGDGPFVRNEEGKEMDDGAFRCLGHTPEKSAVITDQFAMIDTGAAYSSRGYGVLSALLWPSKTVLSQPFDETPVQPRFTIQSGGLLT